jgi:16S rRNA (guanine527-N7)-methyltransferase
MKSRSAPDSKPRVSSTVAPERLESLLRTRYPHQVRDIWTEKLAKYANLLYRWNSKVSMTSIPIEEFVELHIAECLLAARKIPKGAVRVLDFGSGTGLPGIPIQIARPELQVILAESQKKKASFLREAVRELGLCDTEVYVGRVEDMPDSQKFDLVALRAVDGMRGALSAAKLRIVRGGSCLVFTSRARENEVHSILPTLAWCPAELVPHTDQRILLLGTVVRD